MEVPQKLKLKLPTLKGLEPNPLMRRSIAQLRAGINTTLSRELVHVLWNTEVQCRSEPTSQLRAGTNTTLSRGLVHVLWNTEVQCRSEPTSQLRAGINTTLSKRLVHVL